MLWERKDLKQVQRLAALPDGVHIAVGMERQPLTIIEATSAETARRHRGIRDLFPNPRDGAELHVGTGYCRLVAGDQSLVARAQLASFAVLDAAFAPDGFALAEAGGAVRCFDGLGDHLWDWNPPRDSHALRLAWEAEDEVWCAVVWNYEKGGPSQLVSIDGRGKTIDRTILGRLFCCEFMKDGRYLVVSRSDPLHAEVLCIPAAEAIWQFDSDEP
jgi:hypothetical protein